MKYFVVCVLIVMSFFAWWTDRQENEVVSTKELGVIDAVSGGGMWATRVQIGGIDYPLVGDITVAKGTKVVLQVRSSDARYVCDAASLSTCFKVRDSKQTLGQMAQGM